MTLKTAVNAEVQGSKGAEGMEIQSIFQLFGVHLIYECFTEGEGLWSVDDQLRVIVNTRRFKEHGPELLRLNSYAGRHLQFDPGSKLRPSPEFLRRHRSWS